MTDWNLIIQGNISLLWIQECLKPENNKKTVEELLNGFKSKNQNCEILNPGSLFMATYLLFLYPKEKEFKDCDKLNIKTDKFIIIENENIRNKTVDNAFIIQRIRNSLAHGNFTVGTIEIIFEDWTPNDKGLKPNYFKSKIKFGEFGEFINEFMFEIKRQKIN
jgi:hypothetical protein